MLLSGRLVIVVLLFSSSHLFSQALNQLSFIPSPGMVSAVQGQESELYFSDIRDSFSFFKSVDISEPTQPTLLDSFMTAGYIVDFDVNGNFAYLGMADNEFGLRIIDISDPTDIREVVFIEEVESAGTFFKNDTLYVADGGGLSVYDISKPDTLAFLWSFSTNGDGTDVFAFRNHVYLNAHNEGLFIINKTTHNSESLLPSPDISIGIAVNPGYAFFADNQNGLIAANVSDPQNPVAEDTLTGNGEFAGGVATSGVLAYFCDGPDGLKVMDVSSPQVRLVPVRDFKTDGIFAVRVAVENPLNQVVNRTSTQSQLIYLASADLPETGSFVNGVYILDHSDPTSVGDSEPKNAESFTLEQNYPNPFNPATNLRYSLPFSGQVQIEIYNLLGQKVRTLLNGVQSNGEHTITWDGKDDAGRLVAGGIYYYRLTADEKRPGGQRLVQTKRMILLK